MSIRWTIVAAMLLAAAVIAVLMIVAVARDVEADKRDAGGGKRKTRGDKTKGGKRIDLFHRRADDGEEG